ncbi:MAG: GSU2403 family nucleotidyltransferase fold protein [Thiohalomonadales bacterium]
MEKLPDNTALLYSELLQQCAASLPVDKGISYITKTVGGKVYWYLELVVGKQKRQVSLGRDSEDLRTQIEAQKTLVKQSEENTENRQRLVAMLTKGGVANPSSTEARVLEVLERAGVFLAGGVLIGSHAFSLYGNLLGMQWSGATMRTQDMDVACSHIPVGISRQDTPLIEVLKNAGMGFFEVPALDRKAPSTMYKIYGQEFHVDMLTPLHGAPNKHPVYLSHIKAYADPLRFLDYLLEDTLPAVVVAKAGIIVNVPDPSRFALHKLVVSVRRSAREHNKAIKDIKQAQQLLTVLINERPGEVMLAIDAAKKMPKKFIEQLCEGLTQLENKQQEYLLGHI